MIFKPKGTTGKEIKDCFKYVKRANEWIGKYFKAGPMPKYLADQLKKGNVEITIPGKFIQKGESNGT